MLKEWGVDDPETAREGAATIHRESQHMKELVENLLSLARGDEGPPLKPHLHDLDDLAAEAVVASKGAANGRLSVRPVPARPPGRGSGDRARGGGGLALLLDNSVKDKIGRA